MLPEHCYTYLPTPIQLNEAIPDSHTAARSEWTMDNHAMT